LPVKTGVSGLFLVTASIRLNAGQRDSDGPRPRFLPTPLINARAAVLNRQFCQDLSRTARKVLYGVLAFYTLGHPEKPIFAFRETLLPETLLDSRASLYRGLQEAEDKGYLRREQVRTWGSRCYGQFSRSHIFLLDKALVMLGLESPKAHWGATTEIPVNDPEKVQTVDFSQKTPDGWEESKCALDSFTASVFPTHPVAAGEGWDTPAEDAAASDMTRHVPTAPTELIEAWEASRSEWQDDASGWEADCAPRELAAALPCTSYPQAPSRSVRHGLQESELTLDLQLKGQLPTREQIPEPSSLKDSNEKSIDPHTKLPQDVLPLMKLGVSKTLIYTLMAYAKRQGQQGALGAAVKLFWQHIESLRGRSVFAYLRKVLSQKRDYAYLLKQQSADEIEGVLTASASTRLAEKLAYVLQRSDGFQVRDAEGHVVGTIRSNGETGYVDGFNSKRGRFAIPANLRFMQAIEEGRFHLRNVQALG